MNIKALIKDQMNQFSTRKTSLLHILLLNFDTEMLRLHMAALNCIAPLTSDPTLLNQPVVVLQLLHAVLSMQISMDFYFFHPSNQLSANNTSMVVV